MKNRFRAISGALALTFMLLFGAVAFARTTNAGLTNSKTASAGVPSANNQRWKYRRHRRHHRREKREWRKMKDKR